MRTKDNHVLVLNKHWVPVDTCTVYTAFSKAFAETARFMDVETNELHEIGAWLELPVYSAHRSLIASRGSIRIPDVMVLHSTVSPRRRVMQFSRRNLMRRDLHTCQYCGINENLTVDHILPKTRGGRSNWVNCVMACTDCNSVKADRTPVQANMALLPRPDIQRIYPNDKSRWNKTYEPAWQPTFRVMPEQFRESWKNFLPEGTCPEGM